MTSCIAGALTKSVCTRPHWFFGAILLFFAAISSPLHAEEGIAKTTSNGARYELIGRYDVKQLNAIMKKGFAEFESFPITYTPARNAVKLYRVTYPSIIPELGNKPTIASGLIAIPETNQKSMPMVSFQHGTSFGTLTGFSIDGKSGALVPFQHGTFYGRHEVPSFPEQSLETQVMIAQFAGQGYVMIAADYFGLGLSTEHESYMAKWGHQQACLDMYYSAREVLARENIEMTELFVTGWSQGGYVAMAFLEKLESLGIPVRAAFTASAPSDPFVAVNAFLNFPRKIDASWLTTILALSSFAFEESYHTPGLAQSLINPDQYEIVRKLYLRSEKDPFDSSTFPTDLHKLIRPEYFNSQYLAESTYGRLLKENQAYRWVVQTSVRNYYGEVDEAISIGLGKLPMAYQQSMGNTKVEALSAGSATHTGTFVYSIVDGKKWFDSLLTH